jgi:hypothetical protein
VSQAFPRAKLVLIALIAGGLYYRSHRPQPLIDKDTAVLADLANTKRNSVVYLLEG